MLLNLVYEPEKCGILHNDFDESEFLFSVWKLNVNVDNFEVQERRFRFPLYLPLIVAERGWKRIRGSWEVNHFLCEWILPEWNKNR